MKRDKSYYGRIAKNTQRAYYFIEHQGRSPWNYHVHAIGVWCEELSDIEIVEIKTELRRVGGSSGKIDKPWEDDPYRKLRYILKPSYGNRGNGRKTKSTDRCLNQDLFINLNPSPWKGQMLPTNRVYTSKIKNLVLNYFSEESDTTPTQFTSLF